MTSSLISFLNVNCQLKDIFVINGVADILKLWGDQNNKHIHYALYRHEYMKLDRKSSKTDTFHKPTTSEPHVKTNSEQIITFHRHEYWRVGVFRIEIG